MTTKVNKSFIKTMINDMRAKNPAQPKFLFYLSVGVASIFGAVAGILYLIAKVTGLSYNQINIIVYYGVIPFTWCWMLDSIFGFHFLKIVYALFCVAVILSVKDFRRFCDRMFNKSVDFLNYFDRWGSDYYLSSMVICVVVPVIIYGVLIGLLVY